MWQCWGDNCTGVVVLLDPQFNCLGQKIIKGNSSSSKRKDLGVLKGVLADLYIH